MTPTPTTVTTVRGKSRDTLLADPNFIYVGRRVAHTVWTDSIWGNPFGVGRSGPFINFIARDWYATRGRALIEMGRPATPIDMYDAWIDSRADLIAKLPDLIGKKLGCWCGYWRPGDPPIPCHAHRLAVRANRMAGVDVSVRETASKVAQVQGEMF